MKKMATTIEEKCPECGESSLISEFEGIAILSSEDLGGFIL